MSSNMASEKIDADVTVKQEPPSEWPDDEVQTIKKTQLVKVKQTRPRTIVNKTKVNNKQTNSKRKRKINERGKVTTENESSSTGMEDSPRKLCSCTNDLRDIEMEKVYIERQKIELLRESILLQQEKVELQKESNAYLRTMARYTKLFVKCNLNEVDEDDDSSS